MKLNTPYTVTVFGFTCLWLFDFGHCVSRGILGAVNIQLPHAEALRLQHPAGAHPSALRPALCRICHRLPLPWMHSRIRCANSGCDAFSFLQAVLENSFALSTEVTWGTADPFPGYDCAVSQAVGPSSVSRPDSSISRSPAGTRLCLHGGLEHPWCPRCAMCICKNRAGVHLPVG